MKNLYLFLLSLMATLVLFMIFSFFFYRQEASKKINLTLPIEVVLKSTAGQSMDFWNTVNRGIDEAAKEFGIQVNISGPNFEKEIDRQIIILEEKIKKNPPFIILATSDFRRLSESVNKANDLKIPVITLDSDVDSVFPKSFVGTDNIIAGIKAGVKLKALLKDDIKKEIAIVSHLKGTASAIDRETGARKALVGEKIIGTWYCDVEEDKAYKITMDLMRNEKLGGIVALNEIATLGVARAMSDISAHKRIKVVGFDNSVRELTYLEQGIIDATVVQRPYNMGYLAIKTAAEYLSGEKIDKFIDTGSILITKDNMFKRKYQELIFPFSN